MSNRARMRQVWADIEFVNWLENVKAKRQLGGNPISTHELTREIIKAPSVNEIEKEILNQDKSIKLKLRMRFDGML